MNDLTLFNDLFDGFGDDFAFPTLALSKVLPNPKVDVKEDKDAYTLEMDLPGKTEKDVDIELKKQNQKRMKRKRRKRKKKKGLNG